MNLPVPPQGQSRPRKCEKQQNVKKALVAKGVALRCKYVCEPSFCLSDMFENSLLVIVRWISPVTQVGTYVGTPERFRASVQEASAMEESQPSTWFSEDAPSQRAVLAATNPFAVAEANGLAGLPPMTEDDAPDSFAMHTNHIV